MQQHTSMMESIALAMLLFLMASPILAQIQPPLLSPTLPSTGVPTFGGANPIQTVVVGEDDGESLVFNPPVLNGIAQGSRVHFDFRAVNHSLTESTFDSPCTPITGSGTIGMLDMGFINT